MSAFFLDLAIWLVAICSQAFMPLVWLTPVVSCAFTACPEMLPFFDKEI
jgi:hypothetical protein